MKITTVIIYFLLMLILVPLESSFADSSYRCGDSLVTTGDTIEEVIAKCGAPSGHRVTSHEVSGSYGGNSQYHGRGYRTYQGTYTGVAKDIETLTYNCGEGTIIHILTFKDGKLTDVKTGGRGRGPNQCE